MIQHEAGILEPHRPILSTAIPGRIERAGLIVQPKDVGQGPQRTP